MADYVTSSKLKTYLGITGSTHDAALAEVVTDASRAIDAFCGRSFADAGSATARTFAVTDAYCLKVDDFSTTTGLVVKTDDNDDGTFETTWTASDYELEPFGGLGPDGNSGWPYHSIRAVGSYTFPAATTRRGVVQVTARWGWTAVPDVVERAALIVSSDVWKRKDAPFGVAGFGEFGSIRVSGDVLRQAAALLAPYRWRQSTLFGFA